MSSFAPSVTRSRRPEPRLRARRRPAASPCRNGFDSVSTAASRFKLIISFTFSSITFHDFGLEAT